MRAKQEFQQREIFRPFVPPNCACSSSRYLAVTHVPGRTFGFWSRGRGLNLRPADYEYAGWPRPTSLQWFSSPCLTFFALLAVVLWPLCTLLRTPPLAQSLPDGPKPKPAIKHFNSRVFVGGVSLPAASKTADPITPQQPLDRGGWEGNPLLGRHPSPAKQAGINAAILAAQSRVLSD